MFIIKKFFPLGELDVRNELAISTSLGQSKIIINNLQFYDYDFYISLQYKVFPLLFVPWKFSNFNVSRPDTQNLQAYGHPLKV